MTEQPPKKQPPPRDRADEAKPSEADRPTLSPPFDVQAYARATAVSGAAAADDDEVGGAASPVSEGAVVPPASERITLTNEAELELARARSAQGSDPPQARASVLSIADALAPNSVPPVPPARSAPPDAADTDPPGAASLGPEITEEAIEDPVSEMRDRLSLGDYTGALEMADLLLAADPENAEAAECAETCRDVLEKMYVAKVGPLGRVPIVIIPRTQLRWLSMDHRAGFILSLIDGASTIEMVLDLSGMPRIDTLRILHDLAQKRILAFR